MNKLATLLPPIPVYFWVVGQWFNIPLSRIAYLLISSPLCTLQMWLLHQPVQTDSLGTSLVLVPAQAPADQEICHVPAPLPLPSPHLVPAPSPPPTCSNFFTQTSPHRDPRTCWKAGGWPSTERPPRFWNTFTKPVERDQWSDGNLLQFTVLWEHTAYVDYI